MRNKYFSSILKEVAIDIENGLAYELTCIEELQETVEITPRLNDMNFTEEEFKDIWKFYSNLTFHKL